MAPLSYTLSKIAPLSFLKDKPKQLENFQCLPHFAWSFSPSGSVAQRLQAFMCLVLAISAKIWHPLTHLASVSIPFTLQPIL